MRGLGRQFGPAGVVRPEYPSTPTVVTVPSRTASSRPSIVDLSKEVASRLTTEFSGSFTCRHNSSVIYPLESLKTLKVDCWPYALERRRAIRAGFGRFPSIAISMQQQAPRQEVMDILTDLADDVLHFMLHSGRWVSDSFYAQSGAFQGTVIFDQYSKYDANVFTTIMLINFSKYA